MADTENKTVNNREQEQTRTSAAETPGAVKSETRQAHTKILVLGRHYGYVQHYELTVLHTQHFNVVRHCWPNRQIHIQ